MTTTRRSLASLARAPDGDEPKRRADGTVDSRSRNGPKLHPGTRAKLARIARGEAAPPHVIGTARFGRGRLTTCARCAFECSGATDEVMASAWNAHAAEARR